MSEVEKGIEEKTDDSGVGEVPGKPGKRRRKTTGEALKAGKLKEYAHWVAIIGGLIPAVTASIISVMTAYRGEPEANRAYEILAPQVNRQKVTLQIMLSRLSKIEGRQEGFEFGKLNAKIDALTQENQKLRDKLTEAKPTAVKKVEPKPTSMAVAPKPKKPKCAARQVLGDDGKCHWVKKAVAAKFRTEQERVEAIARKLKRKHEWLRREKMRRKQLEQRVQALKKLQVVRKSEPILKAVPSSLKDAKK